MVFKCPKGLKKDFKFKEGTNLVVGGCRVNKDFLIIKEVKKVGRIRN